MVDAAIVGRAQRRDAAAMAAADGRPLSTTTHVGRPPRRTSAAAPRETSRSSTREGRTGSMPCSVRPVRPFSAATLGLSLFVTAVSVAIYLSVAPRWGSAYRRWPSRC